MSVVLLNCVGPYRDYGEPVIKACLEAHTDYIDLCGTFPGNSPSFWLHT